LGNWVIEKTKTESGKQKVVSISINKKQSERSGARSNNASKRRSLLSIEPSEIHQQIGHIGRGIL
jgi:hypothetical protein